MSPVSDPLLLCSWNIHLGMQLDLIRQSLRASQHFGTLDLLLLQESSMRQHVSNAEAIARELGPAYRALQRNVDQLQGRTRGLAVVWNSATFELHSSDLLPLPHLHPRINGRHRWLHPLRLRPRSVLRLEGVARGRTARLYVVHLSPIGFAFQTEQMAAVLRDAAHREARDMVVIAGDFNSLRMDRRKWAGWFAAREREGFQEASRDVEWTFRSPALPLRQKLDNALVKAGNAALCSAHCPLLPGSDHLPLFFAVRPGSAT